MTTGLSRWMPAGDPARDRFNRLLEQAFGDVFTPMAATEDVSNRRWMPAVDVEETSDAFVFTCELPGLTKEDVGITLENNVLTIRGERRFDDTQENRNYHRVERAYGAFSRSFTLPSNVKADAVEAAFKEGLLTVTVPKLEEAKPRSIEIR